MVGNPRRRVVHMTSVHDAADTRILHKECATLAERGYEVVLVAPGSPKVLPPGVRHRAVRAARSRFERVTSTMWQVYRAARAERADVYHFHDPELAGVGIALRLQGARVVFDVHEDLVLDARTKPWIPRPLRPIVSALAHVALKSIQGTFTAIVPATPAIAQSFSHRRTIVVRNYPRLEELVSPGVVTPYEERPLNAIYLGAITLVRGVEQMVRAMEHPLMPQGARLTLAGDFEDDALLRRVGALPGWSRVDALGRVSRDDLAPVLARSRIGLLVLQPAPNFEQSLPTKLFEYMGAGLPVIASRFMECREIVEEYGCGVLVDPEDTDAIARAMQHLFTDAALARAMGERGRAAVQSRYQWRSEAKNLVQLYAQIL